MSSLNLSKWALEHKSFMIYCMIAVTVAGMSSYFRLGRGEDPDFTFRTMVVQAAWPGATLDETLLQVTERIERKLQETQGLDFLRSYTRAGVTTIFVNLKGATKPADIPDIWYQVRKNVGDMRHTLPAGVIGPGFDDDFGDTYGLIYGFTADGFSHRELRDHVEAVRSRLLNLPDVSKIEVLGAQDEQIFVEFSTPQLAGLGIDRSALIAALQAQNAVSPAGTIQTGNETLSIRVTGAFESERDILDVNVLSNGRLIRLRDIADVRRALADPPQPMFRVNGQAAIGLAIAMRSGGDILALGKNVARAIREITADLPIVIEPHLVADQPVVVEHAIGDFMTSLWQAIAIIMAVSLVSLGLRAGAVVALSIPLTLALVFPIMELAEIDLQRISLGALIIALGLLVDDAMTTVDVMTSRLAQGDDKTSAASYAYSTLAFPMLTGSFVSAAGFVPIGLARSSAGEYTFSIFAVVGIALIVSWITAVLFAPLLGVAFLKRPNVAASEEGLILRLFRSLLVGAMRLRWVTIATSLACLAAAVAASPLVPRQFFPASDRPELVVDLDLPQNASIFASADLTARVEKILAEDPDVASWSTYVGRGAIRFYLPLDVRLANDFFSQIVIIAKDVAARDRLHARLETTLAEQFPSVVGRIAPLELGPPVGWPVQYRVSGPDAAEVRGIALRLAEVMGANDTVRKINFDWIEPARKLRIKIDQDQARLLGLSSQALAAVLNKVMTGQPVTQVRDDIYLVDVIARATDEQRVSLSTLQALQIALPNGRTVPLGQVASFEYDQELPLIWRRQRVPTLTVQADTAGGRRPRAPSRRLPPRSRTSPRASPRTTGSRPAARSRRARSRRPRFSSACR
jgi:multidrug efflux pump subunit AcrB